jgi:homoserine kinase
MKSSSSHEIPSTKRPILGPLRVSTSAPSSSSVVNKNYLFDLDGVQIKKLQQLIKDSQGLHVRDNVSKESLGDYKRKQKIIQLEKEKMEECRLRRYEMSAVSMIHRLAAAGDEYNLREQLTVENFNVNGRDILSGRTILITACIFGQSNIVRMLLRDYNVDICRTSLLSEQSPLHYAVISGSRPTVLLLMTSHANVNAFDKQYCTALHLVNSLAVIKLLLKNGADPCIRSREVFIPQ